MQKHLFELGSYAKKSDFQNIDWELKSDLMVSSFCHEQIDLFQILLCICFQFDIIYLIKTIESNLRYYTYINLVSVNLVTEYRGHIWLDYATLKFAGRMCLTDMADL